MDAEIRAKYERAGIIAAKALHFGISQIKPGVSMRSVLDQVEEYIRKEGGLPAFPAQSCVNDVAAHFCPTDTEDYIYQPSDLVKLDVGVHIDGYIADNATSISLDGKNQHIVDAAIAALDAVQAMLRPGMTADDVGRTIQTEIERRGLQPIRNLTGHGLARFTVHTKPTMPNCVCGEKTVLQEGMVVAIEPFATNGSQGLIYNSVGPTIFSLAHVAPVRSPHARDLLKFLEQYNGLPFTTRWLTQALGQKAMLGLSELRRSGLVVAYPPLPEKSNGLVAQHEKTFIITADGCQVTTKLE